jgi:hypothetical protein
MDAFAQETARAQGHHAPHESFLHLSDLEWQAVQRMAEPVGAMLLTLSRDEQHASISRFIQHELDEARSSIALLEQQGAQKSQLLRHQQQATTAASARPRRPEPLKIEAVECNSLARWIVELDDTIETRRINDDAMRVTFVISNLGGRAKTWARG